MKINNKIIKTFCKRNKYWLFAWLLIVVVLFSSIGFFFAFNFNLINFEIENPITKQRNLLFAKMKKNNSKIINGNFLAIADFSKQKDNKVEVKDPTEIYIKDNLSNMKFKLDDTNLILLYPLRFGNVHIIIKKGQVTINFKGKFNGKNFEFIGESKQEIKGVFVEKNKTKDFYLMNSVANDYLDKFFTILETLEDFQSKLFELKELLNKLGVDAKDLKISKGKEKATKLFIETSLKPGRLDAFETNVRGSVKSVINQAFQFKGKNFDFILIKSLDKMDAVTNIKFSQMLTADKFYVLGTLATPSKWAEIDGYKIEGLASKSDSLFFIKIPPKKILEEIVKWFNGYLN